MKKRIMSLLLAMVMTVSLLPGVAGAAKVENFSDVSKDAWYYSYVDFVADKGYFVGTSDTTFSPEMTMTRAMFVVVMAALEGVKVDNNVAPFADVPANTWYSGAVAWAAENGVIAGIGDNKFAPDAEITREQMAVIMNAYINWHSKKHGEDQREKAKIDNFLDKASVSSWAVEAVDNCRAWGLIVGAPDGNFYPQNNATRAEVATVVYNLAWMVLGGGGGGSRPSKPEPKPEPPVDPEYTDYIYEAVKSIVGTLESGAATLGFYADVELAEEPVDNTRPLTIAYETGVSRDAIKEIVKTSVKEVIKLVNGETEMISVEEIKDIVVEVYAAFGETPSVESSKEIAKEIYAEVTEYGNSIWANLRDEDNKYYTGDITVSVGNASAVIEIGTTAGMSNKVKNAAKLSVAFALEMYQSLKSHTEFTDEIVLSAVVTVEFSDNLTNDYEKHTDNFPYVYPVTFELGLSTDGLVEYRYDNGHDILFAIPPRVVNMYEDYANKAIDKVLGSDMLKNYAQEKFGIDLDAVMNDAVETLKTSGALDELVATIEGVAPGVDAEQLVEGAMNQWIRDNYTKSNNLMNFVLNGEANFNNSALYQVVSVVAGSASDVIDEKMADLDLEGIKTKLTDASTTLNRLEAGFYAAIDQARAEAEAKLAEELAKVEAKAYAQLDEELAKAEAKAYAELNAEVLAPLQAVVDAKQAAYDAKPTLKNKNALNKAKDNYAQAVIEVDAQVEALVNDARDQGEAMIDEQMIEVEAQGRVLIEETIEAELANMSYIFDAIADGKALIADAQNAVDKLEFALTQSTPDTLIDNLKAVSVALKAIDTEKAESLTQIAAGQFNLDLSMLDSAAATVDGLVAQLEGYDPALKPFIIAVICDALKSKTDDPAPVYAVPGTEAYKAMTDYVDAMIAENAVAAREKYLATMGESAAEMQKYLDTVSNLLATFRDYDKLAEISFADLAKVLKSAQVTGLVASLEQDSLVNKATNLIAKLPAKASVKLGAFEISEAALAEVQAAETAAEACVALAGVLEQAPTMCLKSFEDGETLTVAYGSHDASLGLYIVVR